jgi:putative ABC transport system ATP-binding protein
MIELAGVDKVFNRGAANEFIALHGIDLVVPFRQATVLKGPSGSGKTTLLSILGGMARPTAGRITLDGRELTSLPERFLTEVRRSTFGFIFQQFNLFKGISTLENVMLPAFPLGVPRAALARRAEELLAMFDLSRKAQVPVELLSGGEAQRVAIARALINDPPVVVADEPTAHLDTALSEDFLQIMAALKAAGKTLIMASHDPLVCEAALVDRVVAMRDGRLVP